MHCWTLFEMIRLDFQPENFLSAQKFCMAAIFEQMLNVFIDAMLLLQSDKLASQSALP